MLPSNAMIQSEPAVKSADELRPVGTALSKSSGPDAINSSRAAVEDIASWCLEVDETRVSSRDAKSVKRFRCVLLHIHIAGMDSDSVTALSYGAIYDCVIQGTCLT